PAPLQPSISTTSPADPSEFGQPETRGNTTIGAMEGLEVVTALPAGKTERPPVLFVHGTGCGAWIWERWQTYFADRGYATTAVSLRGHGRSKGSYRSATVSDYVADVRQVLATFHDPPVLVGHSLGARLIQLIV